MPIGETNAWLRSYRPTFEDYLNEVVGPLFSPSIQFTLVPTDTLGMLNAVEGGEADFTFTSPNIFGFSADLL
jgi:hypothetical protein